jgi:DNA-binding ferritin-like protein
MSKNVPTNPKLWEEILDLARGESSKPVSRNGEVVNPVRGGKGFQKYPSAYCVPLHSEALTQRGWVTYDKLNVGDNILTYSFERKGLVWGSVLDIHFFESSSVVRLHKQSLNLECTMNHKWVHTKTGFEEDQLDHSKMEHIWSLIQSVKCGSSKLSAVIKNDLKSFQHWWDKFKQSSTYDEMLDKVKYKKGWHLCPTDSLYLKSGRGKILASAPYLEPIEGDFNFSDKNKGSWISDILSMDLDQLESFFAGCVMCDGWQNKGKLTYGFSQKDKHHADAFELAAFLTGRRVRRALRGYETPSFGCKQELSVFTVNSKNYFPTNGTSIEHVGDMPVWCPETTEGTWVMRQNGHITITGNSNGWALAQYKRLGGKWKKEASDDYKMPRKWDKEHCESKSCDDMGFSEKASCRPYKNCYSKSAQRVAERYGAKRDDPKMKNTGKGGLDTWFAGHGGGDPDDRSTWGDWVAVTPVQNKVKREDGSTKEYEAGDIVGPCGISKEPEWKDITSNGKNPLKCMPREKAWDMPKKERAQLAKNKRRQEKGSRGKKPVMTPTFSEKAKEVVKKAGHAQPAQDLAGVKTWVDKNNQDQIQKDKSAPEPSRADSDDGKPQRDRVLPLPSGHPEGRTEYRAGPPVVNSPPDSSGQGGVSRKPKDPAALSDHPDGKALHERPRSSGIPGDEYGHPYIDQSTSTGLKRRVDAKHESQAAMYKEMLSPVVSTHWDLDEDGELVKVSALSVRAPRKRQRKQTGEAARKYKNWKMRNRSRYRSMLRKRKREYASNKNGIKTRSRIRQKRVRKTPHRFKRFQSGGVSTKKQISKRDNQTRNKKKGSTMINQILRTLAHTNNAGRYRRAHTIQVTPLNVLQLLLAILRGAHWFHWNSHWQVKGSNFYGNHLLLQRVYEGMVDEIDTLAEKIIGTYGSEAIQPVEQAQLMANKLMPVIDPALSPLERALAVEEVLQKVFKVAYEVLKKSGSMSLGMDDFIMSMASAHETNIYLLRQACR